ncbi:hypothetical protein [Streptomyces hoynatensis]|uniref:Uncharacterized protein n=1 Tax=Streptomyces hoynatensis TaxID=1141874 RepID=A0A3A9ZE99_9ACTN|nr:hypothetical protein [Streptomyces hoynatensis]RKN45587.1 hypothetical protein D7294_03660 [Streptomyces hoynatensis]
MSADGLYYLPEGFREGARRNGITADAAEEAGDSLRRVRIDDAAYAGAGAFPAALATVRDTQARSLAQAAQGRDSMAAADSAVAATGEEMDATATEALGSASTLADRAIADSM